MSKYVYYTTILTILLCGCTSQNSNVDGIHHTVDSFKNKQNLRSELCDFGEVYNPNAIYYIDSLIFIKDNNTSRSIFIYDDQDYKLINNVVSKGRGRDELIMCWGIQKQDSLMWVFDLQQGRSFAFQYDDFINDPSPSSVESVSFGNGMATFICKLNNGSFVGSSYIREELVTFFTPQGVIDSISNSAPKYPFEVPQSLSRSAKHRAFEYRMQYNSNKDKFVLAYTLNNIFEIYNSNGDIHKRIICPTPFVISTNNATSKGLGIRFEELKFRFNNIQTTDNAIYLLYDGNSFKDKEDGKDIKSQLFVFDYDGNPISHYTLDQYIYSICVNENDKCFYALSEGENGIVVLKYKYTE